MAENNDNLVNGVNGDETTEEFFDDTDFPPLKSPQTPSGIDVDRLNTKIADLERAKSESETRITELKSELEKLRADKDAELEKLRVEKLAEFERAELSEKTAEMLAKRAAELEGEVARLQHDFITASNDALEAKTEITKLNSEIFELKKEKAEVEGKVKVLEVKMEELVKKSEDSENLIRGCMEKIGERDIEVESDGGVVNGGEKWKGLKEKLPVFGAVTAGVILAGGVMCYVRHSRN